MEDQTTQQTQQSDQPYEEEPMTGTIPFEELIRELRY